MPRTLRGPLAASCAATALLAAGCGSRTAAQLPPPATPPRSPALAQAPAGTVVAGGALARQGAATLAGGRLVATVDGRVRVLAIRDARTGAVLASAPAGVGPTHVACAGAARCYVADTRGEGLLVFLVQTGGRALRLTRRVYLPGGPYAIAVDAARHRLWVTLPQSNHLALLPAHGRPHVLARFATIRQPDAVGVDRRTGAALVTAPSSDLVQRVLP